MLTSFLSIRKFIIAISVIILLPSISTAQVKQTTNVNQVWAGYFNQTRFSSKWGIWADAHLRTKEDFFTNFSQAIVRLGVTYYFTDEAKLTAGYAYIIIKIFRNLNIGPGNSYNGTQNFPNSG